LPHLAIENRSGRLVGAGFAPAQQFPQVTHQRREGPCPDLAMGLLIAGQCGRVVSNSRQDLPLRTIPRKALMTSRSRYRRWGTASSISVK
jgi:hypothetical protein